MNVEDIASRSTVVFETHNISEYNISKKTISGIMFPKVVQKH